MFKSLLCKRKSRVTNLNIYSFAINPTNSGHLYAGTAGAGVFIQTSNGAPTAVDDTAVALINTPVNINVLDNDSDPDNDPLSISAVGSADNGTAVISATQVTYTPDTDFTGTDTFTYTVSDGSLTDTGNVLVVVGGDVNSAAPGTPTTLSVSSDTGQNIEVNIGAGSLPSGTITTTFTLVQNETPSPAPGSFLFAGIAFNLNAYQNGELQDDFTFNPGEPAEITLTYTDEDIDGLDESNLTLFYYNEDTNAWALDGISVVSRDEANNTITIAITHLTGFGLFTTANTGSSINIVKNATPADGTDFAFTIDSLPFDFERMWGWGVDTGANAFEICTSASLPCQGGSSGSGDGQFDFPEDVALDATGHVFVVDGDRIQKFDSNGNYLAQWGSTGTEAGQFNVPKSIVIDDTGNMYIAERNNARIQKLDSNGNFLRMWGWGVDTGANAFEICTPASLPCQAGIAGNNEGQFSQPRDMALDVEGNLYLTNFVANRVQKFDSNGNYLTQFGPGPGGNSAGQFFNPDGIMVDTAGNIYVGESGNNRIQKLDSDGNFVSMWGWGVDTGTNVFEICTPASLPCQAGTAGDGDGQLDAPVGLALDLSGNVTVVDYLNDRIQTFDTNGNYLGQSGSGGNGAGEFFGPTALTIDDAGNIYVTDAIRNRIQVLSRQSFSLDDAMPDDGDAITDTYTLDNLDPGSYSFSEIVTEGWRLTNLSCDTGDWSVNDTSVTVDLGSGEDVTCTFENNLVSDTVAVTPGTPATLGVNSGTGQNIEVNIGAGSLPSGTITTTFTLVQNETPAPAPGSFLFAGISFNLNAYQDGELQDDFTFNPGEPVEITLTYTDEDVDGLDESNLTLFYYNEDTNSYALDGISVVSRDVDNNTITLAITHLTEFALFQVEGDTGTTIYLPLVTR